MNLKPEIFNQSAAKQKAYFNALNVDAYGWDKDGIRSRFIYACRMRGAKFATSEDVEAAGELVESVKACRRAILQDGYKENPYLREMVFELALVAIVEKAA